MDAKPTRRAMGSRGDRGPRLWVLATLVLAAALVQACTSDNTGPAGPNFAQQGGKVPVVGFSDTNKNLTISVTANPNAIQFNDRSRIVVIVTNTNGLPLPGKTVQVGTTAGQLDAINGVTGPDGTFSTFLKLEAANFPGATSGSATVSAFVDGVGPATVVVTAGIIVHPPAPELQIVPPTVTRTIAVDDTVSDPHRCTSFAVTVQFTVAGGVPPYSFTTTGAWPNASVDGTGKYTGPNIGPQPVGALIEDFVTVKDNAGSIATAKLTVTCSEPGL